MYWLGNPFWQIDRTRLSHQYSKACTELHRHTFTFASLASYKSCLSGPFLSPKSWTVCTLYSATLLTLLRFTAGINNSTLLSEGNLLLMTSWTASLIHTRPNTYLQFLGRNTISVHDISICYYLRTQKKEKMLYFFIFTLLFSYWRQSKFF